MIQCENWWNLAKQFASRSPPLHFLSSPVQRTLMKALVLGGFAHMDSETKQQYWTEVTALALLRPPAWLCSSCACCREATMSVTAALVFSPRQTG